jgi:hypothetical protein
VGQAVRSAKASPANPHVIPYFWQYCSNSAVFPCYASNHSFHLGRDGINAALRLPYELGADGLVLWIDSEETKRTSELTALLNNITGPLGKQLIDEATKCSAKWCSSNGRCHPLPPSGTAPPPPTTRPPACACFDGFDGPACKGG